MARLPLVFSLCAMAHCRAGYLALQEAAGRPRRPEVEAAQALLVDLETLREHGLRMLVDWPASLGEPPKAEPLRAASRALALARKTFFGGDRCFGLNGLVSADHGSLHVQIDGLRQELETALFDQPAAAWLAMSGFDALQAWAQVGKTPPARFIAWIIREHLAALGASDVAHLAEIDAAMADRWLDHDPEFEARPRFDGQVCETTPLSRQREQPLIRQIIGQFGNGILARTTSRLLETASLLARLAEFTAIGVERPYVPTSSNSPLPRRGLGQVEAARGRLMHRVDLERGRIKEYRIVAPTEWNFHPDGAVARGLSLLPADSNEALRQRAEWLVHAVDPCVGFRLSVE